MQFSGSLLYFPVYTDALRGNKWQTYVIRRVATPRIPTNHQYSLGCRLVTSQERVYHWESHNITWTLLRSSVQNWNCPYINFQGLATPRFPSKWLLSPDLLVLRWLFRINNHHQPGVATAVRAYTTISFLSGEGHWL